MSAIAVPYLGRPGSMVRLPSPNSPISAPETFGDVSHGLASGATAITRRLYAKKTFTLPYTGLTESEAGVILGFYRRAFGPGPFVLVDPSVTNVLPLDVAACGARTQAAHGWYASSGTIARGGTPPQSAATSGVLTWSPSSANSTLTPCASAAGLNLLTAPAYLPGEALSGSLWVNATSTATITLILAGYSATGVLVASTLLVTQSVGTSWTRLSVTAAAGASALSSAALVVPQLKVGSTFPTSVSIAGAQLQYSDVVTGWQQGAGSPRVLPTTTPGRDVQQAESFPTDHSFVLAEAA